MKLYKPCINKYSSVSLVLYGEQSRVETVYRECKKTVKRLEAGPVLGKAKPFTKPPKGQGSTPSVQDIMLWTEALTKKDKDDIDFLCRLTVTARNRSRPEVR